MYWLHKWIFLRQRHATQILSHAATVYICVCACVYICIFWHLWLITTRWISRLKTSRTLQNVSRMLRDTFINSWSVSRGAAQTTTTTKYLFKWRSNSDASPWRRLSEFLKTKTRLDFIYISRLYFKYFTQSDKSIILSKIKSNKLKFKNQLLNYIITCF